MSEPQGLGRPGPHQPDFQAQPGPWNSPAAPRESPLTPTGWPTGYAGAPAYDGRYPPPPQVAPPGASWAGAGPAFAPTYPPPGPGAVGSAPGSSPPPAPPRRRRRGVTVATLAVSFALVVGAAGWFATQGSTPESPPLPSSSESASPTRAGTPLPSVIRSGRATPEASASALTGGVLGRAVAFKASQGSGTVTVTAARWTNDGVMAPQLGTSYLLLDLRVAATAGKVTAGMMWCRVVDGSGTAYGFSYGPALKSQLATTLLNKGDSVAGQIGFELARGPVTVEFLDEDLRPVAKVTLP